MACAKVTQGAGFYKRNRCRGASMIRHIESLRGRHAFYICSICRWGNRRMAGSGVIDYDRLDACLLTYRNRPRPSHSRDQGRSRQHRATQEHAQRTFRNAEQALRFIKAGYEAAGERLDLKNNAGARRDRRQHLQSSWSDIRHPVEQAAGADGIGTIPAPVRSVIALVQAVDAAY